MPSILGAMQAFRKTAVDSGDQRWDEAEVQQLAKLARGDGDHFTTAGKSFLTCELHGKTELTGGARQTLTALLAAESAPAGAGGGARLEAVLALQEGGSNKFYALSTQGSALVTRWGPIGKEGQSKTESFASPAEADKAFVKTLRSKLGKGYTAADPGAIGLAGAASAPASAPASAGPVTASAAKVAAAASSGPADLAAFLALGKAAQDAIVDWSGSAEKAGLTATPSSAIEAIAHPQHRAFAQKMRAAAAESTGDFEVHDDEYLRVGGPRVRVELFVLPSGEVAGGEVHVMQQGVERPDDYWDNEEAYDDAKLQELADATDVSWSCTGRYANTASGELRTVRDPEYMEWSGY